MIKIKKTPELRFKGFTEEWQERELGIEVADITGGGTPSTSNPAYWNGNIDWYSPTEIGKNVYTNGSIKKITELGLKNSSAKLLPPGKTILFTSRAGIGDMAILQSPGTTNQGFQSLVLKEGYNTYFFYSMGHLIKKFAEKYSSGSTFLEISGKTLGQMRMNTPSAIEQSQIGSFFQYFDAIIALHQRKHDKLFVVKKAMLEKMFPKEGTDVPEIRFKGFTGKWEKKKYNNVFTILSNNTFSRANLNYCSGIVKNIHYGDVLIKFGETIDVTRDMIPFITNDSLAGKLRLSMLQDGDLIIADTAEDEVVGKCTEIINTNREIVVSGLHTIPSRPIFKFALGYLGYFMNSYTYHDQLLCLMQGSKVLSISKAVLQDTDIYYPTCIEEQSKIAIFFKHLDSCISLHQRELDKLKNIKKACLERMFV